jgi:hypothetical protein
MRWYPLLFVMLAACTSTWQRQQSRLAEDEADGKYAQAMADDRWLIDNAIYEAPGADRLPAAEARRYLHLAKLAVKAGDTWAAVAALREALTVDPQQASAVRAEISRLPLPPAQLDRLKREFAWNSAALASGDDADLGPDEDSQCWSYRVREVQVRHRRELRTADGLQRQVTYDARPWRFDADSGRWQAEGPWVPDVGLEIELADGPEQPRYRAVAAANHGFVSDDRIPPCHRTAWHGPYDAGGTVFVAERLPTAASGGTP